MRKNAPPCPLGYGGDVLCSSGSDQRALADACHGLHLLVTLAIVQKFNCMLQLTLGVLLRPTLPEVGILSGNRFAGLGALHDHAPLVFRKGQHDGQNQISRQSVLYKSHVQDVHPDSSVKKLPFEMHFSIFVGSDKLTFVSANCIQK